MIRRIPATSKKRSLRTLSVVLLGLCALAVGFSGSAWAQDISSDDIVKKLTPLPQTRSPRGVEVIPGKEDEKPSIDLHIGFEFNSARLDTDGLMVLKRLGLALNDPRLDGYRFEIAGHTDAVGSDAYNQDLSERRARAVHDSLAFYFDIDPDRLTVVGYGKTRLLDPSKPTDSINRRVQITNIGK